MNPAAGSQQTEVSENILDLGPEFNQTARHEHADGKTCEVCEPKVIEDHEQNAAAKDLNRDDFAAEKFQITAAELQRSFIRNGELLTRLDGERAKLLIANDTIKGLRESLTDLMKDYKESLRRCEAAEQKILGFERMCAVFAERLDAINADFIFLTGKGYEEWLAADKSKLQTQADGFSGE